ncbi:F-box domain-containing protein [Mycena sanguinolenta]|uniref:F-box domain-containing protein n=1 Tax=Mycena sanguinolenta TaxID=230812 RepID=A0A8H6XZQ8_9AGAR|nr:F-box domain-containing protein [Mycena sanguinolenta]
MSTAASRAAGRARISEIDAKISSLKESIRVLTAEKLRTQEYLDSYAYPVLTLPNEITSEIFLKFIPEYPFPPPLTGSLSPTTLTYVCHRWREIALSTAALWRGILVPVIFRDEPHLLSILESWLSRSGCLPLSILMEDIFDVLSEECVASLVLHRARWEYVTLAVLNEPIIHSIQGAMPLLRQFEIRSNGVQDPLSPVRFCEVPRLRSATMWELRGPIDVLPWSQLTSLTLVYVDEWPAILKETVNLVHCHLFPYAEEDQTIPDIRLLVLESLVLSPFEVPDQPATNLLLTFITPALRTLEVPEAFLQPDPIATLASFISKSECDLQKIRITGDTCLVPERVYRSGLKKIPRISFNRSLTDYNSYEKKLARRRYKIL